MDIISELNLHPCRIYFQGNGKSESTVPVSLVQDRLQYSLKSVEIENMRDREIESAYHSGMQATITTRFLARKEMWKMKALKDRIPVWQEKET